MTIELITEAVDAGARRHKSCAVLGISCRTLRRWSVEGIDLMDRRGHGARQRKHPQALSPEEKSAIVQVCHTPEHQSLEPSQIVPRWPIRGCTWPLIRAFTGYRKSTASSTAETKRTRPEKCQRQKPGCPGSQSGVGLGHHVLVPHDGRTVLAPGHGHEPVHFRYIRATWRSSADISYAANHRYFLNLLFRSARCAAERSRCINTETF